MISRTRLWELERGVCVELLPVMGTSVGADLVPVKKQQACVCRYSLFRGAEKGVLDRQRTRGDTTLAEQSMRHSSGKTVGNC